MSNEETELGFKVYIYTFLFVPSTYYLMQTVTYDISKQHLQRLTCALYHSYLKSDNKQGFIAAEDFTFPPAVLTLLQLQSAHSFAAS